MLTETYSRLFVLPISSVLLVLGASISTVTAAEWSFEQNPIPHINDYTAAENKFVDQAEKDGSGRIACAVYVEAEFQIYLKRYPEFKNTGTLRSIFARWKRHQVYNQLSYNVCIVHVPSFKLAYLTSSVETINFHYCGRLIDTVVTKADIAALEALREAIDYANSGSPLAVETFLGFDEDYDFVALNPDVEYYFRSIIRTPQYAEPDLLDTSHLRPLLSAERLAFVDKATKTRDLDAVIATTAPCRVK